MAKSTKRIAFGADQPSAFVTLIEDFRDFPQLQGKYQGIRSIVGARPALPVHPRRGGFI